MYYYIWFLIHVTFLAVSIYGFRRFSASYDSEGRAVISIISAVVFGIASCASFFCSSLYFIGKTGTGTRVGVITQVEEDGIIWKTKDLRLVSANEDGTFASNGTEYVASIVDETNYAKALKAYKEKRVVEIEYKNQAMNPWEAEYSCQVVDIE